MLGHACASARTGQLSGENVIGSMVRTRVRVALAAAVAAPDASYATVLDEDSFAVGQFPLGETVREGLSFYVMARRDMLVADFDHADDAVQAEELCTFLRREGLLPVLVASGQPGHRHVFCKIPEGRWDSARHEAKRLRADVRVSIRPPLTPHRQGLAVDLLSPTDPMDAVWWLRSDRRGQMPAHVTDGAIGSENHLRPISDVMPTLASQLRERNGR
jgi:hypothetical protein